MADYRVAVRYAKSLLELAQEQGVEDKVLDDIKLMKQVLEENRELYHTIHKPIVAHRVKLSILKKIFTGKIQDLTLRFFELLTNKKREDHIYEITRQFVELYRIEKGIASASVTTAVALPASIKKELIKLSQKISDRSTVELEEYVDPDIIGGFILKVEDKQIDESVETQLSELKKELIK